ncbi:hypothetical protein BDV28DRAFT_16754 [Aspergillus coremiiformis]|uniref:Uncharacterized protein n=1 Tax=Aspergillus coremiiformis TaxID=138285 RepID=A0A5N6ZG51_9EURO|nr:hypothetical protein BDV28DRAFT_16754 [Aspergillus coremiiformis]
MVCMYTHTYIHTSRIIFGLWDGWFDIDMLALQARCACLPSFFDANAFDSDTPVYRSLALDQDVGSLLCRESYKLGHKLAQ